MKINRIGWVTSYIIFGVLLLYSTSCKKEESGKDKNKVADIDGNVYNIITIGSQTWMVENLKTTRYNDGTPIPNVTENGKWDSLSSPAYCWYNNDSANNKYNYGALYNWFTVNTGKICPLGWHIPSDTEWNVLFNYLGGISDAGGKLKEVGTAHWSYPNDGVTNESGFTALPGGRRNYYGVFFNFEHAAYWWSSTLENTNQPVGWTIGGSYSDMERRIGCMKCGYSIRCIKD